MHHQLLLMAILVIIPLGCAVSPNTETGTWGDQGDGTYRNPILNADYPDVDIERVGETLETLNQVARQRVALKFPRFTFRSNFGLAQTLVDMGNSAIELGIVNTP